MAGRYQDEIIPYPDETLDELRLAGLRILQKKDGYRFSLDPVLLCGFVRIEEGDRVADLGTGSGIIPLVLARKTGAGYLAGVENQPTLAARARRNVLLNGLEGKIEILEKDLRDPLGILGETSFDVVVANPPYRQGGSGRIAHSAERAAARHELAGGLRDFLQAAAFLLKEGGRFNIIFLAERLAELLAAMREEKLEPKRLRCVHSRQGGEARMVLVEGCRKGQSSVSVEPPLFIYENEGYSAEVRAIYGETSG